MATYTLAVPLPAGFSPVGELFPHLAHAMTLVAAQAQQNWIAYANGAPLPDGRRIHARTGAYARSIEIIRRGDFDVSVETALPYAHVLEEGSPAWDMHRLLDSSLKVRLSREGKRYLIIPFRWGTPGSQGFGQTLPPSTHRAWLSGQIGAPSRIVGHDWRPSGTGAWSLKTHAPYLVRQRVYSWGGRLNAALIAPAGGAPPEAERRMAGMVRMTRGVKGAQHTQYLTFRTLAEGSPGWQHPGTPGFHVARAVADALRPVSQKIFTEAVRRDLAALRRP